MRSISISITTAVLVASTLGLAAPAGAVTTVNGGPLDALETVAPEVLSGIAATTSEDAGIAVESVEGVAAQVTVPIDPSDGLQFQGIGGVVGLGLPFADQASDATQLSNGVVTYDNGDGSHTAALVKAQGDAQVLTILEDAQAPERYAYSLDLPDGAHVELLPDGAVIVLASDESVLGVFDAPWAKDAHGEAVPTHFELDEGRLIQVVQHVSPGTVYPVVADPWWVSALKMVVHFTKQASAQAAARGISHNAIKIALQEGKRSPGSQKGTSVFIKNGTRVVTNDKTGAIITVTRTGGMQ